MNVKTGCIYILTNPSFPKFVKIGYTDNIIQRLKQLNRSECIPYAFRLYAYYEVSTRLTDLKLHQMIDKLNPSLRAIEDFNGKKRVREFYAIDAEEAYTILETIAQINGMESNLHLVEPSNEEINDEKEASEITGISVNRHYFKDCIFKSSLTGKTYKGQTNNLGVLSIIDTDTNLEIPNNSNPSKKAIIGVAIEDLGGNTYKEETLYQRYRKLSKLLQKTLVNEDDINNNIISKVTSNDIRARILRVPKEIIDFVDMKASSLRIKLGSLPFSKYKYNVNGKFISGVSSFYKECGFTTEISNKINIRLNWSIKGSDVLVTYNKENCDD